MQFLYPLLSLVPVSLLLAAVRVWRWIEEARGLRSPIRDKLLRPPGESSRLKVEEADDKIMDTLICFLGFPAIIVVCYLSSNGTAPRPIPNFWTIMLVLLAGAFVLLLERMISLVQQRAHWRLVFNCERLVGEELNRLMCEGCQVFHDVPLGERSNISHVVVAPSGVYAIETHARHKRTSSPAQKAHEVIYDGKHLQFPEGCDNDAVQEAGRKAVQLGTFLSDALQAPVTANPVLTLPGWYVITKIAGEVTVVNPKLVDLTILNTNLPELPAEKLKQISRQLEKICRDVEF